LLGPVRYREPCFLAVFKRWMLFSVVLFACLVLSGEGRAEDCHQTAMTQGDIDDCAEKDVHDARERMKVILDKLMTKVSRTGRAKLITAQKKWEAYRKSQCDFNTWGYRTGSIYPMTVANCDLVLTIAQTELLRGQLECKDGDFSCGGQ